MDCRAVNEAQNRQERALLEETDPIMSCNNSYLGKIVVWMLHGATKDTGPRDANRLKTVWRLHEANVSALKLFCCSKPGTITIFIHKQHLLHLFIDSCRETWVQRLSTSFFRLLCKEHIANIFNVSHQLHKSFWRIKLGSNRVLRKSITLECFPTFFTWYLGRDDDDDLGCNLVFPVHIQSYV